MQDLEKECAINPMIYSIEINDIEYVIEQQEIPSS